MDPQTRVVRASDVVEIFKDPETEQHSEGFGLVWEVYEADEDFYELIVSFMGDPHERRVPRRYRKRNR